MNKLTLSLIAFLIALLPDNGNADTPISNWYLPKDLNDENSKIAFSVDSTWHEVHGKTSGIAGKAWLSNPKDQSSVNVTLKIPVRNFDTDNKSRDEELRDIMNEKEFPDVLFSATKLLGNCTPEKTKESVTCSDKLISKLKIRDIEKDLEIPLTIDYEEEGFRISGTLAIKWAEYNVEDPSIFLIASVDPVVNINFSILIEK